MTLLHKLLPDSDAPNLLPKVSYSGRAFLVSCKHVLCRARLSSDSLDRFFWTLWTLVENIVPDSVTLLSTLPKNVVPKTASNFISSYGMTTSAVKIPYVRTWLSPIPVKTLWASRTYAYALNIVHHESFGFWIHKNNRFQFQARGKGLTRYFWKVRRKSNRQTSR